MKLEMVLNDAGEEMKRCFFVVFVFALFLSGCATYEKRIQLSPQIGRIRDTSH